MKRIIKIYVASSWRNQKQPLVVYCLRQAGFEVYDFRNPTEGDVGFSWNDIDTNWELWTKEEYRENLDHWIAKRGFKQDLKAMKWANVFVGVQPYGISASSEMGWAAGQGKKTILLLETEEPELMVKMFDYVCCNIDEVLKAILKPDKNLKEYKGTHNDINKTKP